MINNLINLAKKENISLEVCTLIDESHYLETLNDEMKKFNVSKTTSYAIKAIYNNKVVSIYTETISNPEEIINAIKANGDLIDNDNKNRLCENDFDIKERKSIAPDLNNIKKVLFNLNDEYHKKYPFIINIGASVEYNNTVRMIDNENHHLKDSYNCFDAAFYISGKKDEIVKSKYIFLYGKEFNIEEIKRELEKAINKLELSFDAKSVKTDKYKVLLDNITVKNIIKTFYEGFHAKKLDMKISPFTDKLGQKIFSDKITILEEPLNPNFTINKHFDLEGTLTYNKEIIKDGVFKTCFNTIEYAIKNNTKPTGNSGVITNMYIKPGNKSYDELVSMMNDGIIIDNVVGLHAGVNTFTGDISLQATGLLVENGRIIRAIDTIILQTNIFELLSNVIEVGNDLREFSSSFSSPSLLLDNITISGNL